jgi:hypothetical protein
VGGLCQHHGANINGVSEWDKSANTGFTVNYLRTIKGGLLERGLPAKAFFLNGYVSFVMAYSRASLAPTWRGYNHAETD